MSLFFLTLLIIFALFVFGIVKIIDVISQSVDKEVPEISLPYHAKQFFFSKSEQEFFKILNAHLDAQHYTVFPKVRLGDFVEVDYPNRRDRTWWNKIRAKHVDYLIWNLLENRICVAIELDGSSHNSRHMQDRDRFVNKLYETVGLRLERVKVGSSFEEECKRIIKTL